MGGDSTATPGILALDSLFTSVDTQRKARFTFDCKLFAAGEWNAYLGAYVRALNALIQRYHLQGRANVECMDAAFLDRVKAGVPGVATFYYATDAEAGIALVREKGWSGITIEYSLIGAAQVRTAHAAGSKVAVFGTGGDWSHRRALELGADMIQTDDLPGLLSLLGR
jgi:hypothetical protein